MQAGIGATRHHYIDNLRVTVIMFVVLLHLAVTYSGLGLWYYNEKVSHDFYSQIFFGIFQANLQAFSMGMLFFVAGYFTPGSFSRKGFGRFVKDRFVRLGLPSLFYLLVITPFMCWFELPPNMFTGSATSFSEFYRNYFLSGGFHLLGIGPMWFAVALLIFSFVYACILSIIPGTGMTGCKEGSGSFKFLVILGALVSAGAFLLRLAFPIGSMVWGMQLCFFSQYIILFLAGIWAFHTNFLDRITVTAGRGWLAAGLVLGVGGLFALKLMAGIMDFHTHTVRPISAWGKFAGGVSLLSILYAVWESFVAVFMTAGLLVFFRENLNFTNRFIQKLSDSSFAVYMFHPPIIIAITLIMRGMAAGPVVKWAIAGLLSIPVCFYLAYYVLLRTPVLKRIL